MEEIIQQFGKSNLHDVSANQQTARRQGAPCEQQRYQAVYRYYRRLLEGASSMDASMAIARELYEKDAYAARQIRALAKNFYTSGTSANTEQGKHAKRFSPIMVMEIQEIVRSFFRNLNPNKRTAKALCEWIAAGEFRKCVLDAAVDLTISETTARSWYATIGF